MGIKHTVEELKALTELHKSYLATNSIDETPDSPLIIELAQQLIDVQERLLNVLLDTLVASPKRDPDVAEFIGDHEDGIYNTFMSGLNVKPYWDAYVQGFFEPKQQ